MREGLKWQLPSAKAYVKQANRSNWNELPVCRSETTFLADGTITESPCRPVGEAAQINHRNKGSTDGTSLFKII